MTNPELNKIGDVARLLATSTRTIRYYEEEGLLDPVRTEKGTRLYTQQHIDRLRAILNLARNGYPIDSIHKLAHLREQYATGDKSQEAISILLDEWLAGIDHQIQSLKQLATMIKDAQQTVRKCSGCRNEPSSQGCPTCPVKGQLPNVELLNLLWDQGDN